MKREYFLVGLVLILVMFLVGCGSGIITPATDEAKVESVIQDYFLAINNQNWSLAESYCIPGSEQYEETCDLASQDIEEISCVITITNVVVTGSSANAYCSGTVTAIINGQSTGGSLPPGAYLSLQKVDGSWKIDSSD